jgi:GT2 family glycosyltransferase
VSGQIDFSVIIPTRDRKPQLAACLEGIANLEYPRSKFEVTVVDDGSKTSVEPIIAPFLNRINLALRSQPHRGPASARNTGAEMARGRFLVFTDDDCAPAPDWLQALSERLCRAPDHAIGGRIINALTDNPYATASQMLVDYLYAYYNGEDSRTRFFTSNNLTLPADRFRAIGGYDPGFSFAAGEDRELCDRWLHHGYLMTYAPEVVVYHYHAMTLSSFCSQHFKYGRAAVRFRQTHESRGAGRVQVEPTSFYLEMLRCPFRCKPRQPPWVLASLLFLSQAANAAGFFWETGTNG